MSVHSDSIAIALHNVAMTFADGTKALKPISLQIQRGEFACFLGPSGCGKSTLLRIIAGLLEPTTGRVTRQGANLPVGFVFQDAHLLPWRSVLGNVALPLELAGVGKSERLDAAAEILQQVALGDFLRHYPAQLSGGMRMRVSLARALVTRPPLLLLDEPFAALDEITRQRLDEQLLELWHEHGTTICFVTHSVTEATFLGQRAIVFSPRPGRVVLDHVIDLPERRDARLRGEARFAAECGILFRALEAGGNLR